jgi:hypothetical protein
MEPDNSTEPASIEERLSAVLAPEAAQDEPEQETPAAAAQDDDTEAQGSDDQAQEQEASDDWIEVQDDNGKSHKVPAALKDAFERRDDYTRKTMESANLRRAAEDRMHFLDVRERFTEAASQHVTQLEVMRSELKRIEATDTSGWDMQTAWQLRDRRDDLRRQVESGERQLEQARGQLKSIAEQHNAKQWELAVQGARQRIGAYTPGEDAAMLKLVKNLGFDERELTGRFADSRFLVMAHKAAKWDTLQANKPKATEAVKNAPPVLKPGASKGPGAANELKAKDARARLKQSGSIQDAARLFALRRG